MSSACASSCSAIGQGWPPCSRYAVIIPSWQGVCLSASPISAEQPWSRVMESGHWRGERWRRSKDRKAMATPHAITTVSTPDASARLASAGLLLIRLRFDTIAPLPPTMTEAATAAPASWPISPATDTSPACLTTARRNCSRHRAYPSTAPPWPI